MLHKTCINILLIGFLALPMFRDCCMPVVQSPLPNCPHHSSESEKAGTCAAMDVPARIQEQVNFDATAFQNVAAIYTTAFVEPLRSRKVLPEPLISSGPPISLYIHSVTLLI